MCYRIAIVDDRPQALHAISSEISSCGEMEIVLTARNGEDYLKQLNKIPAEKKPEVVLMDVDMPVMDGIEAVRISKLLYPAIQYIMLTVVADDDKLFEAIQAGANGYLLKEERVDTILESIREVMEKQGAPMSPRIARKTLNLLVQKTAGPKPEPEASATNLSDRETEILKFIVSGLNYRQIGEKLFISPHTVRNHIARIYEKLHVSSKAQAVKLAITNKWT